MSLFIENALSTALRSYSQWLTQIMGWLIGYVAWLLSLSPADQITLHAAAQIHWIPIGLSFLGIFGGPIARTLKQSSITNLGGTPKP